MPTLLEVQHTIRDRLIGRDAGQAAALLGAAYPPDRFDIYRNTIVLGLTKALQLNYPAVRRVLGAEFFDGAVHFFIADHPPHAAHLDQYGAEFPVFLRGLRQAASLAYLADLARLEWAVNRALHAPDAPPLDLIQLASLAAEDRGRVRFTTHPSLSLLRADHPVDRIWRAVLAGDDRALATLDIGEGPVHVLIERREAGIEVERLDEAAWRFAAALCAGHTLQTALDKARGFDATAELARHLASGRFIAFEVVAGTGAALAAEPAS
jgi:hypothetical protein